MTMKGYSTFLKGPEIEPHHEIVLYHIQYTCRDEFGAFYNPADFTEINVYVNMK